MNKAGPNSGTAWLVDYRASLFLPWVRPEHVLVEFGPRDLWNLQALQAARKHACCPRLDHALLEKEGVTSFETAASLPDALADVAICLGALEYQLEPREIVVHLKRALKPGGTIVLYALYDPDFRHPRFDRVVEHYFSWNVQTLGNLLVDCGFEFLQGDVKRYPREEVVLKAGRHPLAALTSKLFDPFRWVRIVAANPASL